MEAEQKDKIVKQEQLKTVLELTSTETRKYFMQRKNYCTLDMSEYMDFSVNSIRERINTNRMKGSQPKGWLFLVIMRLFDTK